MSPRKISIIALIISIAILFSGIAYLGLQFYLKQKYVDPIFSTTCRDFTSLVEHYPSTTEPEKLQKVMPNVIIYAGVSASIADYKKLGKPSDDISSVNRIFNYEYIPEIYSLCKKYPEIKIQDNLNYYKNSLNDVHARNYFDSIITSLEILDSKYYRDIYEFHLKLLENY